MVRARDCVCNLREWHIVSIRPPLWLARFIRPFLIFLPATARESGPLLHLTFPIAIWRTSCELYHIKRDTVSRSRHAQSLDGILLRTASQHIHQLGGVRTHVFSLLQN